MNDKQFTDELFRRMYVLGYRKAEIEDGATTWSAENDRNIIPWAYAKLAEV